EHCLCAADEGRGHVVMGGGRGVMSDPVSLHWPLPHKTGTEQGGGPSPHLCGGSERRRRHEAPQTSGMPVPARG
ncbi:hypothetical protein NDU88_000809, partial [Pleurodeles waltl]